ncbi:MAG: oxidoreductase [Tepidiforma sp.]|uniref:Nitroreductase family protein n=1 Tax=Tepidiforma bonchosmolovskayae TaxID=2601677 RepID=A0ABX6C4I0_9CHLR|nr:MULTISPECIES: nitroreductase family protein [Tepidiforma]QFG04168.1 nitroreductase family protein [Tepidiforma bonchosmolovskayae]GIW15463.1 MAG: oxidoreductase [Tepidiforma sp.]
MDLIDGIMTLRAIRRYTAEPVTDDEVLTCLRAARQAPSGGNIQPWQFLVVRDAATRAALGEIYRRAYDRYEPAMLAATPPFRDDAEAERHRRTVASARHLAEHFAEAPVAVLFLMPNISMTLRDAEGPLDVGSPYASVYPAVQNFMLAARALGIGTTLTTVIRIYQDEVRQLLGIPDRYEIAALVPMGRPRGRFGVAPRKPLGAITHWDRFGNRRADLD